eukprot:1387936-Alexandrium_andersonii.AAC.1
MGAGVDPLTDHCLHTRRGIRAAARDQQRAVALLPRAGKTVPERNLTKLERNVSLVNNDIVKLSEVIRPPSVQVNPDQ